MSSTRKAAHTPARGDICYFDLEPAKGAHEIGKYRPCLVLTPKAYNEKTRLCVVVPISSQVRKDPLYVDLPAGLLDEPSQVLCDRVRSLAWAARQCQLIKPAPSQVIEEVTMTIMDILDPVEQ